MLRAIHKLINLKKIQKIVKQNKKNILSLLPNIWSNLRSKKTLLRNPSWFPDFFHQTFDGRPSTSSKWISTSIG